MGKLKLRSSGGSGHWVTLEDSQKVYITGGGQMLFTFGQINQHAKESKEKDLVTTERRKGAVKKAKEIEQSKEG
jgi:ribosome biogenesis protein Nip4